MKRYLDKTLTPAERAEALCDELTVEEMAGQLRYDAPAIPRLGIPAYNWWNEALHGVARSGIATIYPQAIAMAATFDPELLHTVADQISIEGRAKYNEYQKHGDYDIYKGLTFWSPNINLFRDPRWGRGHETYGEDPYLTSVMGSAFVRGLQGDYDRSENKPMRAAACAKHFAVHSGPEKLRHCFDAQVPPKDLEETYLPAFEALIKDAGAEGVMGAYNRVNGEAACASTYLQSKLKEWGFDGYFVSDCWAIQDIHQNHHLTEGPVDSAALALTRGCDVNCGCTYANVLAALNEGLVTEEDIRRACFHLMRTRIRLGMFDDVTPWDDLPYEVVSCKEHKDTSLLAAMRSMVLLKNNGILPLDEKKYKTIAVIGPNSDDREILEGNYNGTADRYVTFLEGIEDRFSGRVLHAPGSHVSKLVSDPLSKGGERFAEAVTCAEHADLVILCIGLNARMEGEEGDAGDGDKKDLLLPEVQRELISRVAKAGKPTLLVCASGSSINVNASCDALLHTWYPGQMGGRALAALLFGDASPCGKLPVTFYEDTALLPEFTDYSMKNRTYRFAENNVLYPFGYGLTYGDVAVTGVTYEDGIAHVTATNRGTRACGDIIQLYMKDTCPEAVPNHTLCGFKHIELGAGETVTVDIPVPERAFTAVNEDGVRAVYGHTFTLYAGTHQPDALSTELTGTACVSVEIKK